MRIPLVIGATLLACVSVLGTPAPVCAQSRAAVRHYERGREHYQAGRYAEAAVELEEAQRLDPRSPTLAYNLARVYELMGDYERATEHYTRLSDMTPEGDEQHDQALQALERVRGAQAAQAEAERERAAREEAEREAALREVEAQARAEATVEAERRLGRRGRADALFYASAALSIGALGGGSLLGFYALRRDNLADDWVVGRNHSAAERAAEQARARRMAIGADVLLGAGVAAGVSALLLYYLRERHPPDEARALRLTLTPSLAGATLWVGGRL